MNIIAGKYEVIRELGKGAYGRVFLVRHVELGTEWALKLLDGKYQSNSRAVERFRREAQAMKALHHPGAVQVMDFGQTRDGQLYMTMEFCEGETLQALLEREGALSPPRAVPLIIQVLEVLEAVHRLGIIHRDLKPENIMIQPGDKVKVLDFGLARQDRADQITKTGSVIGTPMYMAPEQAQGTKGIDHRVDFYSVGMILYEMLSGETPFDVSGGSMVVLMKQVSEYPPPLSEVAPQEIPPSLEAVVFRAIHKDPDHRFSSAREFIDLSKGDSRPSPSAAKRERSLASQWPILLGGVALLAVIGLWWKVSTSRLNQLDQEVKTPEKRDEKPSVDMDELAKETPPDNRFGKLLAKARNKLGEGDFQEAEKLAKAAMALKYTGEVAELLKSTQVKRKLHKLPEKLKKAFLQGEYNKILRNYLEEVPWDRDSLLSWYHYASLSMEIYQKIEEEGEEMEHNHRYGQVAAAQRYRIMSLEQWGKLSPSQKKSHKPCFHLLEQYADKMSIKKK